MRENPRNTLVSAVAGAVLLGGLVGFAVLLPEVVGEAEPAHGSTGSETTEQSAIVLPDELPSGLVAVDLERLPPELLEGFDVEGLAAEQESIGEGLEEVFGVPGASRVYGSEKPALARLTVLDRAPGLFADALPVAPEVLGVARADAVLVRVGDAVCSVRYQQEVPAGQPVDPAEQPAGVRCQRGAGERTYELTAQGLTVDEVVEVLDDLAQG